jgi:short-subunit dehydrogenase
MHVLVTGASSGIGEAMARHWASLGASLTIAARREERLRALAEDLDVEVFVRPTDLSDLEQCEALVRESVEQLGPIDVLINNAGIQYVEAAAGVSPERITRLMTVDLLAPLHLMHYVLQDMLERKQGAIANIASVAGIVHTPGMAHYNSAKAGLAAASESMRVELANSGVHILTVYPGPVHSDMEAAARDQFADSSAVEHLPTGKPGELAKLVALGIEKKKARIIYPKIYAFNRSARNLSQWFTDRFAPPLKDE